MWQSGVNKFCVEFLTVSLLIFKSDVLHILIIKILLHIFPYNICYKNGILTLWRKFIWQKTYYTLVNFIFILILSYELYKI